MAKEELPFDAVDANRAATGTGTATGKALEDRLGTGPEESHDDQTLSPTAEDIQPDYLATKPNKPVGEQAEEAKFLPNGSIPTGVVASNSGFVPVSSIARDQDHADELLEQHATSLQEQFGTARTSTRKALTDEQIDRMGGAELRAVAHDRGYDIADTMGTRATRSAFAAAQAADKTIKGK